jgi:hypothetical protein
MEAGIAARAGFAAPAAAVGAGPTPEPLILHWKGTAWK